MKEVKYCAYCGSEIENQKDKKCKNCGEKILKRQKYLLRVIIYSIIGSFFMANILFFIVMPSMMTPERLAKAKMASAGYGYNKIAQKYMKDNNAKDLSGAFGENCEQAGDYFEILSGSGCNFVTKNRIYWEIDSKTGNAVAYDFIPRYSVLLWASNGKIMDENNKPNNLKYPSIEVEKGIYTWHESKNR